MAEVAWVLRQAAVEDTGPYVDIAIDEGRIVAIGPGLPQRGRDEWALRGAVVLPALVDAHLHLDRTLLEGRNRSGTVEEGRAAWRRERTALSYESYLMRAEVGVRLALSAGATALRTHVEVDADDGLTALEAVLELRGQIAELCELQIVALGRPGVSARDDAALAEALALGADAIGAAPALAPDPLGCLRAACELAERHGLPLDLHLDEGDGDLGLLARLAAEVRARGLGGRAAAAPGGALALASDEDADRVMDVIAQAGLALVTLPSSELLRVGQGRAPAARGAERTRELLARGVTVAAASGSVRDPLNPFGTYDPLWVANLAAHSAQLVSERGLGDALGLVTDRAASLLGLVDYGLFEGARADLLVLRARRPLEAVATIPPRLGVFRRGKLLLQSEVRRTWTGEKPGWVW